MANNLNEWDTLEGVRNVYNTKYPLYNRATKQAFNTVNRTYGVTPRSLPKQVMDVSPYIEDQAALVTGDTPPLNTVVEQVYPNGTIRKVPIPPKFPTSDKVYGEDGEVVQPSVLINQAADNIARYPMSTKFEYPSKQGGGEGGAGQSRRITPEQQARINKWASKLDSAGNVIGASKGAQELKSLQDYKSQLNSGYNSYRNEKGELSGVLPKFAKNTATSLSYAGEAVGGAVSPYINTASRVLLGVEPFDTAKTPEAKTPEAAADTTVPAVHPNDQTLGYIQDDKGRIAFNDQEGAGYGMLDFGSPEANAAMLKRMQNSRGTVSYMPMPAQRSGGGGYNMPRYAPMTYAQPDYQEVPEVKMDGTWGDFIKSVNARKSAIRSNKMALDKYKAVQANATEQMKALNEENQANIKNAQADRAFEYTKEQGSIAAKYQQEKDARAEAEKAAKFYQKNATDRFNQIEKIYGPDTGVFFGVLQSLPKELGVNGDFRSMTDRDLGLAMTAFGQAKAAVANTYEDYVPFNQPDSDIAEIKRQTYENLKKMKASSPE